MRFLGFHMHWSLSLLPWVYTKIDYVAEFAFAHPNDEI